MLDYAHISNFTEIITDDNDENNHLSTVIKLSNQNRYIFS